MTSLGIFLDDQYKYISVSTKNKSITTKTISSTNENTKIQKQIHLFERVISKLANTTEFKLYIDTDVKLDSKAEIVVEIFLNRLKKSGIEGDKLQTYLRITLANALMIHMQTHFEPVQPHPDLLIQTSEKSQISLKQPILISPLSVGTPRPKSNISPPSSEISLSSSITLNPSRDSLKKSDSNTSSEIITSSASKLLSSRDFNSKTSESSLNYKPDSSRRQRSRGSTHDSLTSSEARNSTSIKTNSSPEKQRKMSESSSSPRTDVVKKIRFDGPFMDTTTPGETTTSSSSIKTQFSLEIQKKTSDLYLTSKSDSGKKLKVEGQLLEPPSQNFEKVENKDKVSEAKKNFSTSDPILIPQRKLSEKDPSPRKDHSPNKYISRSLKALEHHKIEKSHIHSKELSSSKKIHLEKLDPELEIVTAHLSPECLTYCLHYWNFQLTNNEKNQYLNDNCGKKITLCDQALLSNNHFLDKPKAKWVLQELSLRALNDAFKQTEFSADINRCFEYVEIWDINDKSLFHYDKILELKKQESISKQNDEGIELKHQELIAKQSCLEFERFLFTILKVIDHSEISMLNFVLDIWKTCIQKTVGVKATNFVFEEAVRRFLHEIADHSRDQEEKDIKYQLRKLLSPLHQTLHATPCFFFINFLPKIEAIKKTSNRCTRIKFINASKVEIYVKNTIQFSKGKCKDFVHLEMENKLSTDLSGLTPWSSEITVHVRPSPEANKNKVDEYVMKPLHAMGIEVYLTKTRPLRKSQSEIVKSNTGL